MWSWFGPRPATAARPYLTSLCLPCAQCNATSCDLTEGELSETENSLRKMVDIGPVMQRAQHRALAGFVSRLLQFLAFARDKLRPEDYTSGHNVWSGEEMKALLLQRVQVDAASFEVLKNYLGQVPTRGWQLPTLYSFTWLACSIFLCQVAADERQDVVPSTGKRNDAEVLPSGALTCLRNVFAVLDYFFRHDGKYV